MFGSSDETGNDQAGAKPTYMPTPYLNIDPNYLRGNDEYILLEDAAPVRSRVQVMFSMIGTATVCGAALGGLESIRYTGLQMLSGKSERMQATSAVLKNGGRIASKFGSVAVLYCFCSIISEKSRGVEDGWNTVIGGGAAGALYSVPGVFNMKKSGVSEEVEKLGMIRRNFQRLPRYARFIGLAALGATVGGLINLYKGQASYYIKEITKKT